MNILSLQKSLPLKGGDSPPLGVQQLDMYGIMVPTDHDIPFSRSFQGTFSGSFQGLFFVLSNIHSQKNDQRWTFQIRHKETIWSWVCQKNGRGEGNWVCVFSFFIWYSVLWLYKSFKQFCLKGVLPQKIFIRISTKSCTSRQFWKVH